MLHENREEVEAHVCAQVRLQEMVNQFQGVVLLLLLLKLLSVLPLHCEDSDSVSGKSVQNNKKKKKQKFYL